MFAPDAKIASTAYDAGGRRGTRQQSTFFRCTSFFTDVYLAVDNPPLFDCMLGGKEFLTPWVQTSVAFSHSEVAIEPPQNNSQKRKQLPDPNGSALSLSFYLAPRLDALLNKLT